MPSPPLVVPNAVQVRILSGIAGNSAANVLHARKTAGATVGQSLAEAVGAAIKSAYTSTLGTVCHSGSGVQRVGVRDLTTANQPEYLDTGAPVGGSATGDHMPAGTSICISLVTALSGRSFRGRVYLGGFTEAANDTTGLASSTAEAAAIDYIEAIQAALTTNGLTLAVLSRPAYAYQDVRTWQLPEGGVREEVLGNGLARAGGISDVISIKSRSPQWETQRRRQNDRGNALALLASRPMRVFGQA